MTPLPPQVQLKLSEGKEGESKGNAHQRDQHVFLQLQGLRQPLSMKGAFIRPSRTRHPQRNGYALPPGGLSAVNKYCGISEAI